MKGEFMNRGMGINPSGIFNECEKSSLRQVGVSNLAQIGW